jgi:drug/metabolite transporter (DMT)-like permease
VRARIAFVYLSVCVLWGSTWLAARIGLDDLPPLRLVAARMALAALLLAPLAWRDGVARLPGETVRWVLGIGLLQVTIPYALMFAGQTMVPSALAAVLFATFPVWLVMLGWWLVPGEGLTGRSLGLALLGLAGVAVLQAGALSGELGHARVGLGAALITAGSISCALANALVRRRALALTPVVMTFVQAAGAAVALTVAALVLERGLPGAVTPRALGSIAWLAVGGTVLTYLGLYWLIPRVPLVAIGSIPLVDTTVAVLLGTLVAGERFTPALAAGAVLVLAASALSIRGNSPPRPSRGTPGS